MLGMDRRRVVVELRLVKADEGTRWRAAAGLRKAAVVRFVRVSDVRMRVGRVGKRIKFNRSGKRAVKRSCGDVDGS